MCYPGNKSPLTRGVELFNKLPFSFVFLSVFLSPVIPCYSQSENSRCTLSVDSNVVKLGDIVYCKFTSLNANGVRHWDAEGRSLRLTYDVPQFGGASNPYSFLVKRVELPDANTLMSDGVIIPIIFWPELARVRRNSQSPEFQFKSRFDFLLPEGSAPRTLTPSMIPLVATLETKDETPIAQRQFVQILHIEGEVAPWAELSTFYPMDLASIGTPSEAILQREEVRDAGLQKLTAANFGIQLNETLRYNHLFFEARTKLDPLQSSKRKNSCLRRLILAIELVNCFELLESDDERKVVNEDMEFLLEESGAIEAEYLEAYFYKLVPNFTRYRK